MGCGHWGRLQQNQASIPSAPWRYNARLYGRGLSKIAHSEGAPARTGTPCGGSTCDAISSSNWLAVLTLKLCKIDHIRCAEQFQVDVLGQRGDIGLCYNEAGYRPSSIRNRQGLRARPLISTLIAAPVDAPSDTRSAGHD
jgi:hypothetical protein